jgi:putative flippase GtrA
MRRFIQGTLGIFYPVFRRFLPYQVYAYLAVGSLNTALNLVLFFGFFHFMVPASGIVIYHNTIAPYTVSLLLAFIATIPTGYYLNSYFAFSDDSRSEDHKKVIIKYFLVVLQGLLADYLLLRLLVEVAHLYPTVAKVISTVVILTVNYLLQKHFTFKNKKKD